MERVGVGWLIALLIVSLIWPEWVVRNGVPLLLVYGLAGGWYLLKRFVKHWTVTKVAVVFLVLGFFIGIGGFLGHLRMEEISNQPSQFLKFVDQFYANVSTEIISIAITVLVINSFYERRELMTRLIREMGSEDNSYSLKAVRELRENGLLCDGSLADSTLIEANLENARLMNANLENVNLMGANLKSASLIRANLENANLMGANFENANLMGANLKGARLLEANLYRTRNIKIEQLKKCQGLDDATMPDGSKYYEGWFDDHPDIE